MSTQTLTLTATRTVPQFVVLKATLKSTVRKKVGVLIEEMQKASLFTQGLITAWKGDFDKAPLKTQEERDSAALMLCYLLCEVIRPAIAHADSSGETAILHFEDEICAILKLILPTNEKVEDYIDRFEAFSKEAHELQKQSQAVDDLFQKKMEELDLNAQQAVDKFSSHFEEHKVSLLESVQQQEEQVDQLYNAVDAVGEQMNAAHDGLLDSVKKMQTFAQDLQKEQQHLQQVAQAGLALLDEVRRL